MLPVEQAGRRRRFSSSCPSSETPPVLLAYDALLLAWGCGEAVPKVPAFTGAYILARETSNKQVNAVHE